MGTTKKYWKSQEHLNQTPEFVENQTAEFGKELSVDQFLNESGLDSNTTTRRDFLKYVGFSVAAATLAACEAPVVKSIPYVNKPEDITPGVANFYASTYFDGSDYASVLVKTREGRPIFVKGNKSFGLNKGAINARISSSVLSLYNDERLMQPVVNKADATWEDLDAEVVKNIAKAKNAGKRTVVLSNTVISPSMQMAITNLVGDDHVQYDEVSRNAIRLANESSFGKKAIPTYAFDQADVVVAFSADFLNDWLLATQYSADYGTRRSPESGSMLRHYQVEANLSMTGSNADVRLPLKPSDEYLAIANLHNQIASATGNATVNVAKFENEKLNAMAKDLLAAKGKSLVVAGHNHVGVQTLINNINFMLGNYGKTIDLNKEVYLNQGDDAKVNALVADMNAGKVGALIILNTNPAYSLPNADKFRAGLAKVNYSVAISQFADETAALCNAIAADNHYLESWADLKVQAGHYALAQPTIGNLYNTRQALSSLLAWAGKDTDAHTFIQSNWEAYYSQMGGLDFNGFWNQSLHDGSFTTPNTAEATAVTFVGDVASAAKDIAKVTKDAGALQLITYTKVGIGNGTHANNPWLMELPDPVSKVTWDNYFTMNPADMESAGFKTEYGQEEKLDLATFTVGNNQITLPVFPSFGQAAGTVGIALGYGRGANEEAIGKAAYKTAEYGGYEENENGKKESIGANAYPFVGTNGSLFSYTNFNVNALEATGEQYYIACTQIHHTIMDRGSVVQETTLETFLHGDPDHYNHKHELSVWDPEADAFVKKSVNDVDLWDQHAIDAGHRWGMAVDLASCIGCAACITSCHAENNVPVVGKDEIRRVRDMHWLRIDRYFSSDMNKSLAEEQGLGAIDKYHQMEEPSVAENIEVVFQPVMCMHCNHAPCETVCPVAATTHSNEGLNQMTYNRCIGTRYCANNCPYKVRRFNWFNYQGYKKFTEVNPAQNIVGRMVLNPDVVVRSRGVMEKCSLCVQRIQSGKLEAKKAGQPVVDGAVTSACQDACPTNAITFGDLNDVKSNDGKGSAVVQKAKSNRAYRMLEEVGTQPNIYYLLKVRNKKEEGVHAQAENHGH